MPMVVASCLNLVLRPPWSVKSLAIKFNRSNCWSKQYDLWQGCPRMSTQNQIDILVEKARGMTPGQDRNFIELGLVLAQLSESCDSRDDFIEAISQIGVGYRKARYLIEIADLAYKLRLPKDELAAIGWTKISILAPYLQHGRAEDLLERAKNFTAIELKRMVTQEYREPVETATFFLTKSEKEILETALRNRGARQHGRQLLFRNDALMKLVQEADKARQVA
jgi:hypothetical protein